MNALVLLEKDQPLIFQSLPDPEPGQGEVVVDLKMAALNHRDVFITQGFYAGIRYPIILGSDGAGIYNGEEVVINPSIAWGDNPRFQGSDFNILGLPRNGTFATKVAVPITQVYPKPAYLSWQEAAAIPLAGLTAYRALFTQGQLQPGDRVLVTGIGGGVALFALQFAKAAGAEIWVTSSLREKMDRALSLGATGAVNYTNPDWIKELGATGGFDVIIDGAGGEGLGALLKVCKPGARIVSYGGTRGVVPNFSPQALFWKQTTVIGSTMGSDAEFASMLTFLNKHKIYPVIDATFRLAEGYTAIQRMEAGNQFGKIILDLRQ
jgi:NADPH:quinone reductase-like Zn-dependent oxidoreductase